MHVILRSLCNHYLLVLGVFKKLSYLWFFNYMTLLYLLVSTCAVIGQFKVDAVAKLFFDLSPTVLNFHGK